MRVYLKLCKTIAFGAFGFLLLLTAFLFTPKFLGSGTLQAQHSGSPDGYFDDVYYHDCDCTQALDCYNNCC
jgi:hypothetical protein